MTNKKSLNYVKTMVIYNCFDNGSKFIFDPENIKESDLEEIDRIVAVQIMTKKLGPRSKK